MAANGWTLNVTYLATGSITPSSYQIVYLPTGEIDTNSSDLDAANTLLAPSIAVVRLITEDSSFNIWKLINWVWVSYYWTFLYNFGEIAPTTYGYASLPPGSDFAAFGSPNFSQPIIYPPTNNIFYNETLFEIYSDYLRNTLYPLYGTLTSYIAVPSLPQFIPVQDDNRLQAVQVFIATTYSCTVTQLKGWVSVLVSVAVADWAFISGSYAFALWFGLVKKIGIKKEDETTGSSDTLHPN